jgi:hypothetical protein
MKRLTAILAVGVLIAAFGSGMAVAQSSGNFDAAYSAPACVIGTSNGSFTGSPGECLPTANGTSCTLLDTTVKTSSGSGVTLLITPSAVTGLYTDTKVSNTVTTSTAQVGVQVCVTVAGGSVLPNTTVPSDTSCVIYDERFQQVNQNFLAAVAGLAACPTIGNLTGCSLDVVLSTLSAHSFNFVAQVPGDSQPHHVTAEWSIVDVQNSTGSVGACVGPSDVTVTQTKIFNNSGSTLTF